MSMQASHRARNKRERMQISEGSVMYGPKIVMGAGVAHAQLAASVAREWTATDS